MNIKNENDLQKDFRNCVERLAGLLKRIKNENLTLNLSLKDVSQLQSVKAQLD